MIYVHSLLKRHGPGFLLLAAVLGMLITTTRWAQAQTFATLYSFTGLKDGTNPMADLVMDAQGNLYGTTPNGSKNVGTVFRVTVTKKGNGKEKVLHSFGKGPDGQSPMAALVMDAQGNLYGTTPKGGAYGYGTVFGYGTAFGTKKYKVLHSFGKGLDGQSPWAALVIDAQGNLYGTTKWGGQRSASCPSGCGTVFEVTPTGTETVLYTFTGGADGGFPVAGLVWNAQGNLYGTTYGGGAYGYGTVFELTPTGTETVLYSFTGYYGGPDGGFPSSGVILDAQGNLYGTTQWGGGYGYGSVFELTPTGAETVLYSFTGGADGAHPLADLIMDAQGNLYGTTSLGGTDSYCPYGCGVVFEITPTGTQTVLHSFTSQDGSYPSAGLVRDANGNLYGTTEYGGSHGCGGGGCGTVFKLTP